MTSTTVSARLPVALLILRLTIFLVMLMWTIDKFVRPEHAASVFSHFYHWEGAGRNIVFGLAGAEVLLLLAFVLGLVPGISYLLVLILHALSTFSSYAQYLAPFEKVNLLFFAAWPMLGACLALYLLRDADTLFCIGGRRSV